MAIKSVQNIQDKAERLYNLRRVIQDQEEENKKKLESLKQQRDELNEELVKDMKRTGILSAKVSSGDSFSLGKRKGVNITNEALAFGWAYENKAVSIDRTIVGQILKELKEVPPGFELVETEYISVRKAKE